jgi:hypothetical protein
MSMDYRAAQSHKIECSVCGDETCASNAPHPRGRTPFKRSKLAIYEGHIRIRPCALMILTQASQANLPTLTSA